MGNFFEKMALVGFFYFITIINLCLILYVIPSWNPSLFPKLKFSSLILWALFLSTMIFLPIMLSQLDPLALFIVSGIIFVVGTYAINSFFGLKGTTLLLAAAVSMLSILILTSAWSLILKKINPVNDQGTSVDYRETFRAFAILSIPFNVAQFFIVPIFMSLVIFPKANYLTCFGYYSLASIFLLIINLSFSYDGSKKNKDNVDESNSDKNSAISAVSLKNSRQQDSLKIIKPCIDGLSDSSSNRVVMS